MDEMTIRAKIAEGTVLETARSWPLLRSLRIALAVALAAPAALAADQAHAASFDAQTPIRGFGATPSSAVLSSTAAGAGVVLVAGSASAAGGRQVIVASGRDGRPATRVQALGAAGDITSPPRAAVDDDGHGAVVFARGRSVFLAVCGAGVCQSAVRVGSSRLVPDPDVAVQPGTGRVLVIWRGRTAGGRDRLQWRITSGGRLGRVHTLGEFGSTPRLGTDAGGKTVAVWTRYAPGASDPRGLRTAARRRGEFTRPVTLQRGSVQAPQLATGADGETIVAWLAAATSDVQSPRAQARVAVRTTDSSFTTPVDIGGTDTGTLALSRAPDGRAVLALNRRLDDSTAVAQAAVRQPGGPFGPLQTLAAPQFISTAFGATAAIDAQGVATVAWQSTDAVFAARSDAAGAFAAPERLGRPGAPAQRPVLAASGELTHMAWASPTGPVTARAPGR